MQKFNRLNGSMWIFRESVSNIDGSLISAVKATTRQRKTIIFKLDNLDFKGKISKRKFANLLLELETEGIYLRVNKYPTNKIELERLRNRLANKYEKRAQFYIDQSIIALAISYEEFLRRLFIKYYTDDPRRISKDKELDIETNVLIGDLADKVDLSSIYRDVAESIVTKLLRNSTTIWFNSFEKILKFSFKDPKFEIYKNQIIELFLVRNSIVHNAKFITKDLINHKEKFIGLSRINPSLNDYKRYKKSCEAVTNSLIEQYNEKYSDKQDSMDRVKNKLISLHNSGESRVVSKVKLDVSREQLNSIVLDYKNASLSYIRSLLVSDFHDSKLLAVKVLIYQYKNPFEERLKNKIFIFCLLNLDLFDDWEMLNLLSRNILTGPRVAGHNMQLLEAMSSYNDPKRSYLLLRMINANPEIASKRHIAWIINRVERNTISKMSGRDKSRLTRLVKSIQAKIQPD